MQNKPSELWYDESGITDDWLRENDPDYKHPENRDYLTARQYRKKAKEKEIPTDPDRLNRRF